MLAENPAEQGRSMSFFTWKYTADIPQKYACRDFIFLYYTDNNELWRRDPLDSRSVEDIDVAVLVNVSYTEL